MREGLGLSEVFISLIVVAIAVNADEHSTAVLMALKNKMDPSLEIAIPEVFAVMSTVWITAHIVSNGESNWIEGAQLLSVYSVAKSLPKGFNPPAGS